jgi:hypothetical protein
MRSRHCNKGRRRGSQAVVLSRERGACIRAAVALVADGAALVFDLGLTGAGGLALHFAVDRNGGALGSPPSGHLPLNARETLDLEAALLPFPTWLSASIESTQTGVDCTLVGLGAELLYGCWGGKRAFVQGVIEKVAATMEALVEFHGKHIGIEGLGDLGGKG